VVFQGEHFKYLTKFFRKKPVKFGGLAPDDNRKYQNFNHRMTSPNDSQCLPHIKKIPIPKGARVLLRHADDPKKRQKFIWQRPCTLV